MRADQITAIVPNAHPEFLRIMAGLPDPPADAYELLMQTLPELHRLFLEKRRAALAGDRDSFFTVAEREAELVAGMDGKL